MKTVPGTYCEADICRSTGINLPYSNIVRYRSEGPVLWYLVFTYGNFLRTGHPSVTWFLIGSISCIQGYYAHFKRRFKFVCNTVILATSRNSLEGEAETSIAGSGVGAKTSLKVGSGSGVGSETNNYGSTTLRTGPLQNVVLFPNCKRDRCCAGQAYGPTFTTGDVIGCGLNLVDGSCFYTKNGHHLGIAFTGIPRDTRQFTNRRGSCFHTKNQGFGSAVILC